VTIGSSRSIESDNSFLRLLSAPAGLNGKKTVQVNPHGSLQHSEGVTLASKVVLAGGTYAFTAENSGDRYNVGEIVLQTGTISRIERTGGSYGKWYQDGVISGDGAFYVNGGDGNSLTMYFRGNNTYSGGSYLVSAGYGQAERIYCSSDTAFGTGPVWLDGTITDKDYRNVIRLGAHCTLDNAIRGRGNIYTGSYLLTLTGSVAPYDIGYAAGWTKQVGTLSIEDLKFGTDDNGCTYYWQYNETDSDTLNTATLSFGQTTHKVECAWLGAGDPPPPPPAGTNYVLFSYSSGADPDMSGVTWEVTAPGRLRGSVWLDSDNNKVMLKLQPGASGTMVLIR
jgi:hypothetical protein